MGGGSMKQGTMSARLHGGYKVSKYERKTPVYHSPNRTRRSPETPVRILTQEERNANKEEARVRANWHAMERAIAAEKARLAAKAKRNANNAKRNNRLAAAAAANVKNTKSLNKVFKNNKMILAKFMGALARLRVR